MRPLDSIGTLAFAVAAAALLGAPAHAAEPIDGVKFTPILDARARVESVDQGGLEAEAVTFRLRAGAEAKAGRWSVLAEAEATLAAINDYNAFPFVTHDDQRRPQFAVIPDPRNLELNRLQLQYKAPGFTLTAGRQRINLDDQRWVGSVGWRQNEQTFDAVRAEAKAGGVTADLTYAISQRTIFGEEAGKRTAFRGDFLFAGLGAKLGPVDARLFSYVLDYDEDAVLANSSQTYGAIGSSAIPLGPKTKLALRASYARQSDHADNPFDYAADYWAFEGSTKLAGFALAAGWEKLGSDNGRAVQTPMATLHKFNGWADLFLSTPPAGLQDAYVSVGKTFASVTALPGLTAQIVFHQFDSARGDMEYGTEWDASIGFKRGKLGMLLKFANYNARDFGSDTRKLWLQAEWAY
ncbi:MAG TPA: alginate export family protein [Sphingomicrobium sp.]|nr:alginate export family protein [Sphingomicrobium sp.]